MEPLAESTTATVSESYQPDMDYEAEDEKVAELPAKVESEEIMFFTDEDEQSTPSTAKVLHDEAEASALQAMLLEGNYDNWMKPLQKALAESERKRKEAERKTEGLRKEQDRLQNCNASLMTQLDACREQTSESNRISDRLAFDSKEDDKEPRPLSSVFSSSIAGSSTTSLTNITADQLVSPKLQCFFGVELEDVDAKSVTSPKSAKSAKSVRHLKSNKSRRKPSMIQCDVRTPVSLSAYRMQRFFGVEMEGDLRDLGSDKHCSTNSVRLRHLQHNQQRKAERTWTETLTGTPKVGSVDQLSSMSDSFPDNFPVVLRLGNQVRSQSEQSSLNKSKKRKLKNRCGGRQKKKQKQSKEKQRSGSLSTASPDMFDQLYDGDYEVDEDDIDGDYLQKKKRSRTGSKQLTLTQTNTEHSNGQAETPSSEYQDQLSDLQSNSPQQFERFLSPRGSGMVARPKSLNQSNSNYNSNRGVANARDSMRLKKTRGPIRAHHDHM